MTTTMYTAI